MAEGIFIQKASEALKKYAAANDGKFPADINQLQAYFGAPVDPAILDRWSIEPASRVPNVGVGDRIITQKALRDEELDQQIAIGEHAHGASRIKDVDHLQTVMAAFAAANPGRAPARIEELMPYAANPRQKAALESYLAAQK